MTDPASAPRAAASGAPRFDERLSTPWWWLLPALGVAVLLAAQLHLGYPGLPVWLGYAVTVPLAVVAFVWLGRYRVRLGAGELQVGDARIPVRCLGEVEVVPRSAKQDALGPGLDPAAYVVHRAWIGPLVRVEVTDPDDRTPYWLFSVRKADALASALRSATSGSSANPGP